MRLFRAWSRRAIVISAAVALLAGLGGVNAAPAAASGGFQDGFEDPVVAPNTFELFAAGQQMGEWTVTSGDVHLIGADFWQAAEGVQSLDLDGSQQGAVATTVATIPLVIYKVSYRLAGNPHAGPVIKTGQVLVNDEPVQSFSFDITGKTGTNMGYVHKSFFILTLGHSITLEFSSTTTPGGFGPVLDDVVVQSCLLILCPSSAAIVHASGIR